MSKKLIESEIVSLINIGLSKEKIVVAYFGRDRSHSYYTFDTMTAIIKFLKEIGADDIWQDENNDTKIHFSVDEWMIFANPNIAIMVVFEYNKVSGTEE